jgi:signal peptidase I
MKPREHAAAEVACGLAEDVIRTFGETRLRVFGTSMVPSILPGDLISVRRSASVEISSGEIILYAREGRMFVHRVVGRDGGTDDALLITRGDLLRRSDPPVSSSELLGKVISIERGGRQLRTACAPGGFSRAFVRLLRTSGRATWLYVMLASGWESLFSRIFSRRLQNSLAGPAARECKDSSQEKFDARLRPQETEGAAKCQA